MIDAYFRRQIHAAIGTRQPLRGVLIGSTGAGKSTFYRHALSGCGLPFVNADEIARQIRGHCIQADDPLANEALGLADQQRRQLIAARRSHVMETVPSDPQGAKLAFFQDLVAASDVLFVIYIRSEDSMFSMARVMQRVDAGGHDVPQGKMVARPPRTQGNAANALKLASLALDPDNSGVDAPDRWRETRQRGARIDQADA